MRVVYGLWAFQCCLIAGAVGCTRAAEGYYGTTEPKHPPEEIWTNLSTEPEWIDPGKCSDAAGGNVITNVFSGLLQPHPATLEPMPDIAERWEVSKDGRIYTFYLRPSTWSDGVPLTAADFVYAWQRVLDPRTASKYASSLYAIRYGEMFSRRAILLHYARRSQLEDTPPLQPTQAEIAHALARFGPIEEIRLAPELGGAFVIVGGADAERAPAREKLLRGVAGVTIAGARVSASPVDAALVGVRALDDHVLQVELESPLPYFLNLVCYYTTRPVPRHVIERLAHAGENTDLWTRPEHIVTNGPYVVSEWRFRQEVLLTKNVRYWDVAHTRNERVRLRMLENSNTVLNMYEAGELDSIGSQSTLPSEFMDSLASARDFQRAPQNAVYFYWLNTQRPPLDDVRVRSALRLAIDRESIVRYVTRAGQVPTADLVPNGLGGYEGLRSPLFDPERARSLLAEAGYGPNKPLPTITLTYNTLEVHKQIAEAVQAIWREHLGVQIEIENQEWNVYLKNLQNHNFQLARLAWIGDYPDPYTFLELLTKASGNNHSQWSDPRYEELVRRANQTIDKTARLALLKQAETLAMEAAPLLPLYVYTRSELLKPYVVGFTSNYEARHFWKYWWIDKRWYDGAPRDRLDPRLPPSPSPLALGAP